MPFKLSAQPIDGLTQFGFDFDTYVRTVIVPGLRRAGYEVPESFVWTGESPLPARIHRGALIAVCDLKVPGGNEICSSSQFVWLDSPGFLCVQCWNHDLGNAVRKVLLPDEYVRITALLAQRLDLTNRNWVPGETVEQLYDENVEHGIGAA